MGADLGWFIHVGDGEGGSTGLQVRVEPVAAVLLLELCWAEPEGHVLPGEGHATLGCQ